MKEKRRVENRSLGPPPNLHHRSTPLTESTVKCKRFLCGFLSTGACHVTSAGLPCVCPSLSSTCIEYTMTIPELSRCFICHINPLHIIYMYMFNSVEHLTQPCEMKDIKSAYCMMVGRLNVRSSLLLLAYLQQTRRLCLVC